jgi:ACT domain-containing protein
VRSVMDLVTADRPGLLVNVVKLLKDISVNVVAAEADTIVRVHRPNTHWTHTHAQSTRKLITTAYCPLPLLDG